MKPGATAVTLKATAAKTPQEAAKVYPGNYWLSLLEPPAQKEFPGTGPDGNGLGTGDADPEPLDQLAQVGLQFLSSARQPADSQRRSCLQGEAATSRRTQEAWEWRLGTGVRGNFDVQRARQHGDATDAQGARRLDGAHRQRRGAAGAAAAERHRAQLVVTLWDVGDDHSFMHDEIATDKNHPTVNANGQVYAVSAGHGQLVMVDPKENSTFALDIPTRAPRAEVPSRFPTPNRPSLLLGQRASVGQPSLQSRRSAQPDDRQQGPGVDDVEDPPQSGPRVVQRRRRTSSPTGSRSARAAGRRRSTIPRRSSSR